LAQPLALPGCRAGASLAAGESRGFQSGAPPADWKMKKLLFILLLGLALPAAAAGLLPQQFAGWTAVPGSQTSTAAFERLAGDAAPILRDCGADRADRAVYQRGNARLTVTLFRLRDATAAYSAYSFLRPANPTGVKPTRHSSVAADQAMLLVGNYVVEVNGQGLPRLGPALEKLVAQMPSLASSEPYPDLAGRLPLDGIVPGSDRYVVGPAMLARALPIGAGDWLGFADGAEAELAQYRIRGQQITFLIVSYPTQQLAARQAKTFAQEFNLNGSGAGTGGRPVVFFRRVSAVAGLVYGTESAAVADKLLGQIHYRTEVTWNEPGFELKDLTMPQYVVGIMIGTGIIMMFVLVASIAFGGFRIVVKHLLPGKVFDRRHSVEILQLGLNSKPIDARDFY
jgi:Family of unknown function (DUF6599)